MADDYIYKMYIKGREITFGLTPECDFPADISQEKDGTLTLILNAHEIKTNSHNFSFLKNCIAISAIAITLGIDAKSLNKRLKVFSNEGKSLFLVDAKESLADWAIWPFVRQFRIADIKKFDQNNEIQYLRCWLNYFFTHEKYPMVMKKNEPWSKKNEPLFFG